MDHRGFDTAWLSDGGDPRQIKDFEGQQEGRTHVQMVAARCGLGIARPQIGILKVKELVNKNSKQKKNQEKV